MEIFIFYLLLTRVIPRNFRIKTTQYSLIQLRLPGMMQEGVVRDSLRGPTRRFIAQARSEQLRNSMKLVGSIVPFSQALT